MSKLNTIEEAIQILEALREGKAIEYFSDNDWAPSELKFPNFTYYKYRIKPELKTIPLDMKDIHIFKTIIRALNKTISNYECGVIGKGNISVNVGGHTFSYENLQKHYEYSNDNGVTWKKCEKEGV